jgi:hypothetical protein
MPTTIAEVFAAVGLVQDGIESVRWGTKPTTSRSGVLPDFLDRVLRLLQQQTE